MSWSKRQLVEQAYAELALAGYVFDLEPEEVDFAVSSMDTLMAQWDGLGISFGYALGHSPTDTDPDTDSGVPLRNTRAVILNVAIALAGSKGKQLPPWTLKAAKDAYDSLLADVVRAQSRAVQMPSGVPFGAGNRPWRRGPVTPQPDTSPLQQNPGSGNLDFLGS